MTFNCQAESKCAKLCCWLLCKVQDLSLFIVIENELGTHFFQKFPCFDMEGRWENKIKCPFLW